MKVKSNLEPFTLKDIFNDERMKQLGYLLDKYQDIVTHYAEGEVDDKIIYQF